MARSKVGQLPQLCLGPILAQTYPSLPFDSLLCFGHLTSIGHVFRQLFKIQTLARGRCPYAGHYILPSIIEFASNSNLWSLPTSMNSPNIFAKVFESPCPDYTTVCSSNRSSLLLHVSLKYARFRLVLSPTKSNFFSPILHSAMRC